MKNEIIYQTCIVVYQYNESDCIKLGTRDVTGYLQVNTKQTNKDNIYILNKFFII